MMRWRGPVAGLLVGAGVAFAQLPTVAAAPAAAPTIPSAAPALLSVQPSSGKSGTPVTITINLTTTTTKCTLEQDGMQPQTFLCGPNTTLPFTVIAAPGPHTLTVCAPSCTALAAAPSASVAFTVLAVVPPLLGLSAGAVPAALAAAGLKVGLVTGPPGAPVVSQDPASGTVVDPGGAVNVSLGLGTTTSSPRTGPRVAAGATVTVSLQPAGAAASSSTRSTPGWYWATVAAAVIVVALAGRSIARRIRRRRPRRGPAGPPPRVAWRPTVDAVRTEPTCPTEPTVELHVRAHATLTTVRKP